MSPAKVSATIYAYGRGHFQNGCHTEQPVKARYTKEVKAFAYFTKKEEL